MLQASTQPNRFMNSIPAGFVGSSMSYKSFIDEAVDNPDGDAALLGRMRDLLDCALQRTGVSADFTGSQTDYTSFRQAAADFVTSLPVGTGASSCEWLPQGWPSALVVSSNTQDSNHVMLVGQFDETPENMAAYTVLGSVLTAKYMLPELRDRRGAYGASLRFDAVSYTHLDVYKRQGDHRPGRCDRLVRVPCRHGGQGWKVRHERRPRARRDRDCADAGRGHPQGVCGCAQNPL